LNYQQWEFIQHWASNIFLWLLSLNVAILGSAALLEWVAYSTIRIFDEVVCTQKWGIATTSAG
jgi:hypothetical protein